MFVDISELSHAEQCAYIRKDIRERLIGYTDEGMHPRFRLLTTNEALFLVVAADYLGEKVTLRGTGRAEDVTLGSFWFCVPTRVFVRRMGCGATLVSRVRASLVEKGLLTRDTSYEINYGPRFGGVPVFVMEQIEIARTVWCANFLRAHHTAGQTYRANDNRPKPRR